MRVPGAMPLPATSMPGRRLVVLVTLRERSPALLPAMIAVVALRPKVFAPERTRRPAPVLTRPLPSVLLMTPLMLSWLPVTATAGRRKAPETVARPGPDIAKLPTPWTIVAMVAVVVVLMSRVPPPLRVRLRLAGMEIGPRRVPPATMYSVAVTEPLPAMAKRPAWTVSLPELVRDAAVSAPPKLVTPEAMRSPAMVVLAELANEPTEVTDAAVTLPPFRLTTEPESGPVRSREPVEVMAPVTASWSATIVPPTLARAPLTVRSRPARRRRAPAESRVSPLVVVAGALSTWPPRVASPRVKAVAPAPSIEPPMSTVVEVVAAREAVAAREELAAMVIVSKLALPARVAPETSTTSAPLPPIWLATMASFLERRKVVPASKLTEPAPRAPPLTRTRLPSATLMPPVKASGASMVSVPAPVLMKPSSPVRATMAATLVAVDDVATSMVVSGSAGT